MARWIEMLEQANGIVDSYNVRNMLESEKKAFKMWVLYMLFYDVIIGIICIGIMYLRFRVFGG